MQAYRKAALLYGSLMVGFFQASAIADLEYRLNLSIKIITDVIWYITQLSVFEVLFSHTTSISGWTAERTRIFMGVLFVTDAIYMLLFQENLDRMSDKVRRGDLDLLLVKPINSQFMLSCQKMAPAYLGNIVIALCWLSWSLTRITPFISWHRLALLIITIPCSLVITYSLRFFFAATALIFTRAENINYVWYQIYRLGTRPDTIYPPWLRYAVLTILPVGFIASVPARMILDPSDFWSDLGLIAGSIAMAALVLFLSTRYWRVALRHYSSASS